MRFNENDIVLQVVHARNIRIITAAENINFENSHRLTGL